MVPGEKGTHGRAQCSQNAPVGPQAAPELWGGGARAAFVRNWAGFRKEAEAAPTQHLHTVSPSPLRTPDHPLALVQTLHRHLLTELTTGLCQLSPIPSSSRICPQSGQITTARRAQLKRDEEGDSRRAGLLLFWDNHLLNHLEHPCITVS